MHDVRYEHQLLHSVRIELKMIPVDEKFSDKMGK